MEQRAPSAKSPALLRPDRSGAFRTWSCVFLAFGLVLTQLLASEVGGAQEDSAGEYEVKGAILYNLMQFVEWPSSADPAAQSPRVLCVLGWDPFGNSLVSLASSKIVDGRPVQIRHVHNDERLRPCHALYISSSERKRLRQILLDLQGASVLTVGDMAQFAARGGMVQFALEDKQVRFDINLDAASQAGLKINSRLLALARTVKYQSKDSSWAGSAGTLQASEIPVYAFRQTRLSPSDLNRREIFDHPADTDCPRR